MKTTEIKDIVSYLLGLFDTLVLLVAWPSGIKGGDGVDWTKITLNIGVRTTFFHNCGLTPWNSGAGLCIGVRTTFFHNCGLTPWNSGAGLRQQYGSQAQGAISRCDLSRDESRRSTGADLQR
jgi:hypothetical protein